MRRFACISLIWAVAATPVGPAWAQRNQSAPADASEVQARELFRRAEVHFNLQEFDRALELYTEAYRQKPLPGFLFNIAQCHRFSQRHADAAFSYRVYLQRAPEAGNRAEVEELIREMDAKAATAPAPMQEVTPAAKAAVAPGGSETVEPGPRAKDTAAEREATRGSTQAVDPARLPAAKPKISNWVWASGGLGVALLGVVVVTGQMASNRSEQYSDPNTSREERLDLREEGKALAGTSAVTLSAGALALAAGAVLWFVGRPRAGAAGHDVAVAAVPIEQGAAFTIAGGF